MDRICLTRSRIDCADFARASKTPATWKARTWRLYTGSPIIKMTGCYGHDWGDCEAPSFLVKHEYFTLKQTTTAMTKYRIGVDAGPQGQSANSTYAIRCFFS